MGSNHIGAKVEAWCKDVVQELMSPRLQVAEGCMMIETFPRGSVAQSAEL